MEIGKGRFGKVYQAKLGGFICAAKVLHCHLIISYDFCCLIKW